MNEEQYAGVKKAAAMQPDTHTVPVIRPQANLDFKIDRRGVMLIEID